MTNEAEERLDTGLAEIFDSLMSEIHTCMPGQVTAFDADTQTVSVRPCLKRKFLGETDPVELPIIDDVPVVYPGSGDLWLVFPVEVDSYVLLVFSERAIATWMNDGGVVDPAANRKFKLSDAVAIPGMLPSPVQFSGAVEANTIAIRDEDGTTHVKVDASRNVVLNDGLVSAVAYTRLKTAFDTLKSELNAFIAIFNAHVHGGVTTGPGSSAVSPTPGVPAVADMSSAESNTVKVP